MFEANKTVVFGALMFYAIAVLASLAVPIALALVAIHFINKMW